MKQQKHLLLILLGLLLFYGSAEAAPKPKKEMNDLIDAFIQATRSKNSSQIADTWSALIADKETLTYMEKNRKPEYALFKYNEMVYHLSAIKIKKGYSRDNVTVPSSYYKSSSSYRAMNQREMRNQDRKADSGRNMYSNQDRVRHGDNATRMRNASKNTW